MMGALENNAELDGSFPITTNLFNKNAINVYANGCSFSLKIAILA